MKTDQALHLRNKMKAVKPKFERQNTTSYPQFRGQWRKPKGIHSKMRRGFRGHRVMPTIGYASPNSVKGLNRKGMKEVLVITEADLKKVDKNSIVVISSKLGTRSKLQLVQKILEMKLQIANIKDANAYVKKIKENIEQKKKQNKQKKETRTKTREEAASKKEQNKEEKKNEPQK